MNVTPLPSKVQGSDVPLERLAGNSSLSDEQKIGEVARQFEAVLLRQILADTQKPVFKTKLSDDSTSGSIYRDMVTGELADSISKSGALGLAQTLEQQLGHQVLPASSAGHDHSAEALPTATAATDAARPFHSRRPVARVVRAGHPNLQNINLID
jgi:peptidoglycan hydrolase FlgJ